ncbi:MAG TPA: hypothetical protein VN924_09985 [Bryobacteraceae bacterium]|nr:hypothetical protein [Bryobacteraceae bacterium]
MRAVFAFVTVLVAWPAISAAQQVAIGSYPVPTEYSDPNAITVGPDGALWFTEIAANKIGRITTAGSITEYAAPGEPWWIVAGPDGALWFTESGDGKIGRMTTSGIVAEYPIPAGFGDPGGIAAGPDGNLWFAQSGQFGLAAIGAITTQGVITEYVVPNPNSGPLAITSGPDGALWFTEYNAGQIGSITTAGAIAEYPIPTPNSAPFGITPGPDGALWFAESLGQKIGRITTAGTITEYPLPSPQGGVPEGITTGPDGALWFTESIGNRLGRITTSGAITEYPLPTPPGLYNGPVGITTGPDGELWFTEYTSDGIAEAVFVTANLQVTPTAGPDRAPLTFSGSSFAPNETVTIYTSGVGSAVLASAATDGSGAFSATARAPIAPYGPRLFLGVGQTSGDLGAANFSVTPKLFVSPSSGPPGTLITLKGYGFGSLERIEINWNNPFIRIGSITAGAAGNFTAHLKVPATAQTGTDTVAAEGFFAPADASAAFTVQ